MESLVCIVYCHTKKNKKRFSCNTLWARQLLGACSVHKVRNTCSQKGSRAQVRLLFNLHRMPKNIRAFSFIRCSGSQARHSQQQRYIRTNKIILSGTHHREAAIIFIPDVPLPGGRRRRGPVHGLRG